MSRVSGSVRFRSPDDRLDRHANFVGTFLLGNSAQEALPSQVFAPGAGFAPDDLGQEFPRTQA
jgi:hypothetical protein